MKQVPEFNCRVPIIDDEKSVCGSIAQALRGHRFENVELDAAAADLFGHDQVAPRPQIGFAFQVGIAHDGRQGYEKVKMAVAEGRPYALVFSDMRMPGWSGLETVEHIRQIDQHCEIIFLTAHSDYSIGEIVNSAGPNVGYFLKPFAVDEVKQMAIKGVVDWNKAREMERLLETVGRLDGEVVGIDELLKYVLGQMCMWLDTDSGALARLGADGELAFRVGCGRLSRSEEMMGVIAEVPVRTSDQPLVRSDLILLPIKEFGLGIAVPGTARLTSERLYLLRVFLEHASLAIRNSEARAELLQSRRLSAMGEALSCVVHDIRGPLTNAQLLVDYLHRADEWLFSQVELCDMLVSSLGQALEVVNDTLDYVRGSVRIDKREVELERELSPSLDLLGLELGRRSVPLRVAIPPGLRARVDTLPLVRALRNLAVNASEALYTTPAPWVEVGAETRDSGVRIWVEDNGPGIPDEMRERLFAPFASVGKAQGTGLGLAVVKIMVEAHGGTITVHSSDKGTRFEIDLP